MNLLMAVKQYVEALRKYGYYPKDKQPSIGKLEKLADLCWEGKERKLSRYIPEDASEEIKAEFNALMVNIMEIIKNEKNS